MVEYNTIIIGAGISGITCAIYLKRAGLKALIIENNIPGGQLNKASVIENYPGYVAVTGSELSSLLLEQVSKNEIDMIYDEIDSIDYNNKVVTMGNIKYHYQYLVFASGRRERLLGLENEDNLIGKGISLCATCDGALYKGQDVIVVGGGSSAVSEAIYLSKLCHKVYLVYRGEHLRAEVILQDRLEDVSNIEVIYGSNVISYLTLDDKVVGVKLDNGVKIDASCIFLAIGYIPNSELFIGNKHNGYIVVEESGKTSIDDVYACGDVVLKNVYQLVTASNDGVLVASSIINDSQSR